jgi:hypothetical protein
MRKPGDPWCWVPGIVIAVVFIVLWYQVIRVLTSG